MGRIAMGGQKHSLLIYTDSPLYKAMNDADLGRLIRAQIAYQETGAVTLGESDKLYYALLTILPVIDKNNQHYLKRCQDGKKAAEKRWSDNGTPNRVNATACDGMRRHANNADTDMDTDTDTDTDIKPGKPGRVPPETVQRIVDHLNEKAGKHYKPTTSETVKLIGARISEGFTEADFFTVIDNKSAQWKGSDNDEYLRPSTLFSPSKFEGYLNAKPTPKGGAKNELLSEYGNLF